MTRFRASLLTAAPVLLPARFFCLLCVEALRRKLAPSFIGSPLASWKNCFVFFEACDLNDCTAGRFFGWPFSFLDWYTSGSCELLKNPLLDQATVGKPGIILSLSCWICGAAATACCFIVPERIELGAASFRAGKTGALSEYCMARPG